MALNTRLTQNIDLQADGTALTKALGVIETSLNSIVGKAGSLGKTLEGGANAGSKAWNVQLKQLNILIGQAQNLQKILDANTSKRAGGLLGALDEQALGRKGAAASRLKQDLTATSSAAEVLEKRLAALNKKFADLTLAGRSVGQRDLAKQLNTQTALKDVQALEREFQKLGGQAGTNGNRTQRENMARLRTEITAVNAELAKMGQNYRRTDFSPQIAQLRNLTDEYRRAVNEARKFELAQPGRAQNAQRTAVGILNQTDSQRLAAMQRASGGYSFPVGISQTVSQQTAENRLADSMNKRLRLLNMIQAAQERGAPTRSVERLNDAYKRLGNQLGEDLKLLTQVNKEIQNTPQARAERARQQINEVLFGDGGAGLAQRIGFASVITTGVFAVINAVKEATKFVIEYESALKQLQAISGSTDTQMGTLARSIGEVGRSSTFSILEITKAATVIAQAGYSAQETGEVLKSAVTLSTASGSSPSESVEVLTSALGAFQLQANEAARVTDTLVTGLNKSKLSMTQMGQAIQYAGATANESGIRLEELTAIAASLANAGIKSGSTIGTGLRQLIVDMKTPTEDFKKSLKDVGLTVADVDVRTKGFAGVVKTLADAGFTAEAAYNSFETRAASAFLAFKGQIGTYDELALSIARGGAAAEAQAKSMDSLAAQFNRLKNDLGVVAAGLGGPFLSALKLIASVLANVIEGITDLVSVIGGSLGTFGLFGETLKVIGLTIAGFAIGGPIGAAIGAFVGLASAFDNATSKMEELRTKTSDSESNFNSQTMVVSNLDEAINGLIDRQDVLKTNSTALQTETVTLGERFQDLYTYLGKTAGSYDDLLNAMLRYRGEALKQQKYEAETLKTNAEIELKATRTQLNQNGTLGRTELNYNRAKAYSELGSYSGNVGRTVNDALNSQDLGRVTTVRNYIAKMNADNNGNLKNTLLLLEERLTLIKQAASLESQIEVAGRNIGIADAASTPEAEGRTRDLTNLRRNTNQALTDLNAGKTSTLSPAIAAAKAQVEALKKRMGTTKAETAEFIVIQSDLSKAEQELARLVSAQRLKDEAAAKVRPEHARKGLSLTGTQVKSEITKAFPGANVYSEKPRSLATQQRLYNEYKAGRGPLAAKPGRSNHGTGNAIDMTPMRGVSMDQVVAYLEGLGLEVTEALNERNPTTGRSHWHFAWKAKTSSFQKQQDSAVEQLRKAQSSNAVGASQAAINALLAKAKAGTDTPSNLSSQLETAISTYTSTSLAKYDADNPSAGLSGAALELQQSGRSELVNKLKEEATAFRARLYREIADAASQAYAESTQAIQNQLEMDTYDAGAPVRQADRNIARASSRLNKDRSGAGTSYYLQQQREMAQINSDRATIALQDSANARTSVELDTWKQQIDLLPEGEDKTKQLLAYNAAWQQLNKSLRETEELQQSVNDRTQTFNQLPLKERLEQSVAAWAENSGVMQDWSTVMENSVGPALEMLSSTLGNVFEQIMMGSMGIKGALKSIIIAVGQFVVNLIAKALALAAIKWFLKLIGVELIDTPGGVGIQKIPGKLQGGEIKPKMMMNGGPTAGYISQGVANKDTVPILGARGEFMLRKTAVDSLGLENVDALNRHGSKALGKMAGAVPIGGNNHQEMSVYVVKPDEKPQLGPRDIVIAITDDMLQGGTTKQLVRKISQGAM